MRCCCGYLSGPMYRLFAYGPADATVVPKPHRLLPHLNPDWFYFSGTGLPRLSWEKKPLNECSSNCRCGFVDLLRICCVVDIRFVADTTIRQILYNKSRYWSLGLSATSFKNVVDFMCAKCRQRPKHRVKWRHRVYGHDSIAILWV